MIRGKKPQTNAAVEKREWLEIKKKNIYMGQDCLQSSMDKDDYWAWWAELRSPGG